MFIEAKPVVFACSLFNQCQMRLPKHEPTSLWAQTPPSLLQPSQPTVDGLSQRTPHSRAAKKAGIRTVSFVDSVQRTMILSYKVLRIDENREYGQTTGAGPGRDPTPRGGGGVPLYGPQNCRTEQCALSAPEAPQILF